MHKKFTQLVIEKQMDINYYRTPKGGPAQACFAKGDLGGGLSAADKQSIISLHNQLRQTVASGSEKTGSNGPQSKAESGSMPDLEWDDALATIAQRWADQCNNKHDSCRDAPNVPAYQIGQNIGYSGTTGDANAVDVRSVVLSWYSEVEYFNKNEVPKFSGKLKAAKGKDIGHYTQIVWADTTRIGCGLRNYYEGGFNRRYLVCNYGPSGNFRGHAIYET